jgi:hypothetical protein
MHIMLEIYKDSNVSFLQMFFSSVIFFIYTD